MATQSLIHASHATGRSTMLRRALQADSAVSLISGLVFLIDAQPIATFTGFPWVWAIEALGAGFLVYAALLFLAARRPPIDHRHALGFVAADAGWAIASVALVMGGWAPLTSAGVWVVLALADVGAVFAVLKYVGMRRAS